MKIKIWLAGVLVFIAARAYPQDPDFYIFLCFGQSDMEGAARYTAADTMGIDSRFMVMAATDCPERGRTQGEWDTAIPPLARCRTGLGPADYFGRTMVENLPEGIRVGVINVSVGGCKIELFEKDSYQAYADSVPGWMANMIAEYDGNPYGRLVELAKKAQQTGVIKGILLHQGESNTGDIHWPEKVRGIYDNLIADLSLEPQVPLLAGQLLGADENGACASMNAIIDKLPQAIPAAHVISSQGCEGQADRLHFSTAGYKELGKRYAVKMLSLLGHSQSGS